MRSEYEKIIYSPRLEWAEMPMPMSRRMLKEKLRKRVLKSITAVFSTKSTEKMRP